MLKTEQHTTTMKKRILKASKKVFPQQKGLRRWAIFEHGHWWLKIERDYIDTSDEATYSVVDAEGPGTVDGFYFEEI